MLIPLMGDNVLIEPPPTKIVYCFLPPHKIMDSSSFLWETWISVRSNWLSIKNQDQQRNLISLIKIIDAFRCKTHTGQNYLPCHLTICVIHFACLHSQKTHLCTAKNEGCRSKTCSGEIYPSYYLKESNPTVPSHLD